jgi:hypothetical protein
MFRHMSGVMLCNAASIAISPSTVDTQWRLRRSQDFILENTVSICKQNNQQTWESHQTCLTHRVQIWRIRWQVLDEAVMVFDEANKGAVLVGGEVVENNNGLPPREAAVALQNRELHAHNRSESCSARQGHND